VAIVANPAHPGEQLELRASRTAADRLGLAVQYLPVSSARDFELAFPALLRGNAEAIVAFPDALVMSQAKVIAEFARRHRVPAVSGWSEFADAGNLLTYGPNLRTTWKQAAGVVDRILRGARPAELPIEQPSSFELVINLRAAETLGLAIPTAVAMRADRVVR
jgi:putative ABC transport system substrate-binding protein